MQSNRNKFKSSRKHNRHLIKDQEEKTRFDSHEGGTNSIPSRAEVNASASPSIMVGNFDHSFECDRCSKAFHEKARFDGHVSLCGRKYKCLECGDLIKLS